MKPERFQKEDASASSSGYSSACSAQELLKKKWPEESGCDDIVLHR